MNNIATKIVVYLQIYNSRNIFLSSRNINFAKKNGYTNMNIYHTINKIHYQINNFSLSLVKREVLRTPNADLMLLEPRRRRLGGAGFVVGRPLTVQIRQLDRSVRGGEAAAGRRVGLPIVGRPPRRGGVDAVDLRRPVVAEEVDGRGVARRRGGAARHGRPRSRMAALLDVFLGCPVPAPQRRRHSVVEYGWLHG